MKIEQEKLIKKFLPIIITIETQEEINEICDFFKEWYTNNDNVYGYNVIYNLVDELYKLRENNDWKNWWK